MKYKQIWHTHILFIVIELMAATMTCIAIMRVMEWLGPFKLVAYIVMPRVAVSIIGRIHFRRIGRGADFRNALFFGTPGGYVIIAVVAILFTLVGVAFSPGETSSSHADAATGYYILFSIPMVAPVIGFNAVLLLPREQAE